MVKQQQQFRCRLQKLVSEHGKLCHKSSEALNSALRDKTSVEAFAQLGLTVDTSTPSQLATRLKTDLETWRPIVKSTGFSAD